MRTAAQVSDSGALAGITRTWTRQPWIGFTGGVDVFLTRPDGTMVAHTGARQFGVDGFRIPFKHSSRTDTWFHSFTRDQVSESSGLDIFHFHAPRDRFNAIVDEIIGKGGRVLDVVDRFAGVGRVIAHF